MLTMRRSLASIATLLVLSAACTHSDAAAHAANASTAAPATTTASANGSLATTASAVHDSITDLADHGRILGDSTAGLWVIMASDFQCPYCKQWHDAAFQSIVRDYVNTHKVRLAFLNMPLSMHPNALPAAEAAMCASVQNKFWPVHEALFAAQAQWEGLPNPVAKFDSIVTAAGVNIAQWRTCMTKHSTLPLIQADRDRARQAGVRSTPTFFVGSKTLEGSDADVRGAIDAALKGQSK
jgi:protein-disulfide isomerase